MDKRIVWLQADGAVWLQTIDGSVQLPEETDTDYADRMAARRIQDCQVRGIPIGTRVGLFEAVYVPLILRTEYKGARAWDGTKVIPDMPKCRDVRREQLRALRKPKLEALDIEYQRADEDGDNAEKKRIADEKQALRDVTDDVRIDEAQTPEALKAVIPDALK